MNFNFFKLIQVCIFVLMISLFFSCASRKKIVYYQNIDSITASDSISYEVKIQPDDLLMIIVSAEDPEIAMPFNLNSAAVPNPSNLKASNGQQVMQFYLVDRNGNIEFPVLGRLQVGGMTRTEVLKSLKDKIGIYIKNPIINMRIMNFKISLHGEVNIPGTYSVDSERITLIEALSKAKDLTIYGRRNNILVIREINGLKSYNRVDITKADFINSPFYYLAQNDVVYVEPNSVKVNASAVGPNTSVIISAISILISLSVLLFK